MNEKFNSIPFVIYKVYEAFTEEKNPNRKLELLNATYANIFRYIGSVLLCEYILEEKSNRKVNEAINSLIRPSLGSWIGFIRVYIKYKNGEKLFFEELPSIFNQLSNVKFQVVGESIRSGKMNSNNAASAILEMRNMLAHGSTPLTSNEAEKFIDIYTPCLEHILDVFLPIFNEYKIAKFDSIENNFFGNEVKFIIISNNGENIVNSLDIDEEYPNFKKGELYLIHKNNEILSLSYFFNDYLDEGFINKEKYVIYDGLLNRSVVYVGVDNRLHLENYLDAIRSKFASKDIAIKWRKEGFAFNEFKEYINELSEISVCLHGKSDKYKSEIYVERNYDNTLDDFIKSDKTAIIIKAEAGVGKTSLLCHAVGNIISNNGCVYFINGSSFVSTDDDNSIFSRFKKECLDNNQFRSIYEFLEFINGYINKEERFVIVIDALNEAYNTLEVLKEIDDIVSQASKYPWIKIIASIRSASYEILKDKIEDRLGKPFPLFTDISRYYVFSENGKLYKELEIKEWTLSEELKAFNLYKKATNVSSKYSFHKLSSAIKELLKNPLNMAIYFKVAAINNITEIVSEKELFEAYYVNLIDCGLSSTTKMLLRSITDKIFRSHKNTIDLDEVIEFDEKLSKNSRIGSSLSILTPYERLKDSGLLQEKWTSNGFEVSFVYQKQLEYLLYKDIKTLDLTHEEIIREFVNANSWECLKEGQVSLLYVIEEWKDGLGYLKDIQNFCESSLTSIMNFRFNIIQLLFKDITEHKEMCSNNLENFIKFIKNNKLISWSIELLVKLFNSGNIPISELLMDMILDFVEELSYEDKLSFYYTGGLIYQYKSNMDKANQFFQKGISLCDHEEKGKYIVQISRTYRQNGDLLKAETTINEFIEGCSSLEKHSLYYAEAIAQKGLCFYALGRAEDALSCYYVADIIAKELKENHFRLFNLLGITTALEKVNKVEKARDILLRIYDESDKLGYQNLMIDAMNGLARKYNILGQYDDAIYWASEGLTLWEYSNFYRGQMVMCVHIIKAALGKKCCLKEIQPIIDKANSIRVFVNEKLILKELDDVLSF